MLVAAAAANFLTRHEEEEVVEDDDDDSAAECDIWERYCGWLSTATVVIWSQMIMIKININSKWARVVLFFEWSVYVEGGGCLEGVDGCSGGMGLRIRNCRFWNEW